MVLGTIDLRRGGLGDHRGGLRRLAQQPGHGRAERLPGRDLSEAARSRPGSDPAQPVCALTRQGSR